MTTRKRATNPRSQSKSNILFELVFHGIVIAGMALVIVAIVHFEENQDISSSKTELDVGSAISCIAYGLLVFWAVLSFFQSRLHSENVKPTVVRCGKTVSRRTLRYFQRRRKKLLTFYANRYSLLALLACLSLRSALVGVWPTSSSRSITRTLASSHPWPSWFA